MRKADRYAAALELATGALRALSPERVASRADVTYQATSDRDGLFRFRFFAQEVALTYPEGAARQEPEGNAVPSFLRILLLHYLITADGQAPQGRWLSFRELPDGWVYEQAFQARCVHPLTQVFGTRPEALVTAAQALAGERLRLGDVSYRFRALPRLYLAVVLWAGDEELPPSLSVLFDAAASHYLPTEDLAVLGGMLSSQLLRAAGAR